jgi:hypothetical protein
MGLAEWTSMAPPSTATQSQPEPDLQNREDNHDSDGEDSQMSDTNTSGVSDNEDAGQKMPAPDDNNPGDPNPDDAEYYDDATNNNNDPSNTQPSESDGNDHLSMQESTYDTDDEKVTSDQSDEEIYPPVKKGRGGRAQLPTKPLQGATIEHVESDHSDPEPTSIVRPRRARAPDLPLVFPPVPKGNVLDVTSVPAEKISRKGVTAKMFFALPNVPPKQYEFRVSEKMVSWFKSRFLRLRLTTIFFCHPGTY